MTRYEAMASDYRPGCIETHRLSLIPPEYLTVTQKAELNRLEPQFEVKAQSILDFAICSKLRHAQGKQKNMRRR